MKKIISVCLCICLISGCDKLLNHGRPVNTAVEDKAPHSLTSNTPASVPSNTPIPTPEPSKSAQPLSDTADTGSSVVKYAVNIGRCAVALAVIVGGYAVYRFFNPKIVVVKTAPVPKSDPLASPYKSVSLTRNQVSEQGYKICLWADEYIVSYDWRIFKRLTHLYFWQDFDTEKRLKPKEIPFHNSLSVFNSSGGDIYDTPVYVYKPEPSHWKLW
ncbi:MAG: hypothetical protein LE169_01625 [Endomicrobium sp.]|nr:hypothetical protein [Endomicrobium sp.]